MSLYRSGTAILVLCQNVSIWNHTMGGCGSRMAVWSALIPHSEKVLVQTWSLSVWRLHDLLMFVGGFSRHACLPRYNKLRFQKKSTISVGFTWLNTSKYILNMFSSVESLFILPGTGFLEPIPSLVMIVTLIFLVVFFFLMQAGFFSCSHCLLRSCQDNFQC